ncbi:hypothetical protein FJZ36_01685 [Candidatus Poribacteria bacterium]|nr:hypothetical protein [Candidatus Poribacteria bacterium]
MVDIQRRVRGADLLRWVPAVALLGLLAACGAQNEFLAEGKDSLKSDKRTRITVAVEQFHEALKTSMSSKEEAETHYLLAYYDESMSLDERVGHFVRACEIQPRKYTDALLYEALRDRDDTVREAVRQALERRYAQDGARIRRELIKALHGKDNRDRFDAAWVLGYLAAKDDALTNELIAALDHKRMETRLNAVVAIEELARQDATRARQAIPALRRKIAAAPLRTWWKFWDREGSREDPAVRELAVQALGTMGATDELLMILQNKGSSLRTNAMDALIASGSGDSAIPVLLGLLSDSTGAEVPWTTRQRAGRRVVVGR